MPYPAPLRPIFRLTFAAIVALLCIDASGAHAAGPLVSRTDAARAGLERSWFTQVGVDPNFSEVTAWTLSHDRIFGVTNSGTAFAVDTNTGKRLWLRQVGRRGAAAFGPGANSKYVAIVSGSSLYMLDRGDGRLLWSRDLGSAPGAGPALTGRYAYVVLLTGKVEAYQLNDPDALPWIYNSKGRTFLRPVTTGRVVSWPTNAGLLFVGRADMPGMLYRVETNDEIIAPPAEFAPYLYVASLDGYLYCVNDLSGQERWRFSTGFPIETSPAVVGEHAYVASTEPAIHAIDTTSGKKLWDVPGANQFVAEGKRRVYAADKMGNLMVLDSGTGALLGKLSTADGITPLVNDQNDRIYLVNQRGLIQCLHEIGVTQPVEHRVLPEIKIEEDDESNPFEGEEPAATNEDTPFAADEPAAAGDADTDDAAETDSTESDTSEFFDDFGVPE